MTSTTEDLLPVETGIIGCILNNNQAYWRIPDLRPRDFTDNHNRAIYEEIQHMMADNEPVDVLTLAERLEGVTARDLYEITQLAPVSANIEAYAKIVRDGSLKRRMKDHLQAVLEDIDTKDATQTAESLLDVATIITDNSKTTKIVEAMDMAIAESHAAHEMAKSGKSLGIGTTLPALTAYTGGFHGPKMITLGGRPGTYKTALALQIALDAAINGEAIGFISLEMKSAELGARALSNLCKVDGHALSAGNMTETLKAKESLSFFNKEMPLYINDSTYNWRDIEAKVVQWQTQHNIRMAIVDYIQIIRHEGKKRFESLSDISRRCKLLAMRLDIPIMMLSQLSRDVEKENRNPKLSDLRECGNIEQDSDIIIFTHCHQNKGQDNDEYEIILAKQRGGPARKKIQVDVHGRNFRITERRQY